MTVHELLIHLYDKILNREIRNFSELVEYTDKYKLQNKREEILLNVFRLIKELHWGFFRGLTRSGFPKLWKELVLSHEHIKEGGNLKRNIQVANLYIALLDIHGYTKFCQASKKNISKLRKLDDFLQQGIRDIAAEHGTLAQRERGDEILVIGGSATDILTTTLAIISSFSQKPIIHNTAIVRDRSQYSINLPDFKISAGIAGGNLSTPLIITENGMLSGFLLNTAARLQARANELSPHESRIVTTKTIYSNFQKENQLVPTPLYSSNALYFLESGPLEFKGVTLSSYEIIFQAEDNYKKKLAPFIQELLSSIKAGLWQQKIFSDLLKLIIKTLKYMAFFSVDVSINGKTENLTNELLIEMCNNAGAQYLQKDNFLAAIEILDAIAIRLAKLEDFDRLILDYARSILKKYQTLVGYYEPELDQAIKQNLELIFPDAQYQNAYLHFEKSRQTFEQLRKTARQSPAIKNKKKIWFALIENNIEELSLTIHSGK